MKRLRKAVVAELLLWTAVAIGTAVALNFLSEAILPANF